MSFVSRTTVRVTRHRKLLDTEGGVEGVHTPLNFDEPPSLLLNFECSNLGIFMSYTSRYSRPLGRETG